MDAFSERAQICGFNCTCDEPFVRPHACAIARARRAFAFSRIFAIDVMTRHAVQRQTSHGGNVDNPGAVAAMLRHLGLDRDPDPDPTTVANECGPQLELAFDFGA